MPTPVEEYDPKNLIAKISIWLTKGVHAVWRAKKLGKEPHNRWGWQRYGDAIQNTVALSAVVAAIVFLAASWETWGATSTTEYSLEYVEEMSVPNVLVCPGLWETNSSSSESISFPVVHAAWEEGTYIKRKSTESEPLVSTDLNQYVILRNVSLFGEDDVYTCAALQLNGTLHYGSKWGRLELTLNATGWYDFFIGLYDDVHRPDKASMTLLSTYGQMHNIFFKKLVLENKSARTTESQFSYAVTGDPFWTVYSMFNYDSPKTFYNDFFYKYETGAIVRVMVGDFQINKIVTRTSVIISLNIIGGFWAIFELGYGTITLAIFMVFYVYHKVHHGSKTMKGIHRSLSKVGGASRRRPSADPARPARRPRLRLRPRPRAPPLKAPASLAGPGDGRVDCRSMAAVELVTIPGFESDVRTGKALGNGALLSEGKETKAVSFSGEGAHPVDNPAVAGATPTPTPTSTAVARSGRTASGRVRSMDGGRSARGSESLRVAVVDESRQRSRSISPGALSSPRLVPAGQGKEGDRTAEGRVRSRAAEGGTTYVASSESQ